MTQPTWLAGTQCAMPDMALRKPTLDTPPGACDTHAHLFDTGERYPLNLTRAYTPPAVRVSDYRAMLAALGIERAVIVHAAVYRDHQITVDALRESQGRWRGIAVADPNMPEDEISRLAASGFCGVRFNPYNNPEVGLRGLEELVARIRPFNWHVQLHINAADIVPFEKRIDHLGVPVVIDHFGHMPTALGQSNPGFQRLLGMLREQRCWVKLAAPMRFEDERPPYASVVPFAHALIEAGPMNVVWGSDWPHVMFNGHMPNDANLLDLLTVWAPDASLRKQILVDNPARLYKF